ncbi:MAG: TRAP transporter TatT component family protein [Acidobacteriota bacterium]
MEASSTHRAPAGARRDVGAVLLLLALSSGCSLRKKAVNTLADVLGEARQVYLSDEDPELIAAALPFNLKTIETLLASAPQHRGLLLTATTAFTLYAYGFVEPESERVEEKDFERAEQIRHRAAHLYLRAYHYGLRGLEVNHPALGSKLSSQPVETCAQLGREDVPLAVWTAAALGGAIKLSKDDPELTADIAVVGALLEQALNLDEGFENGTIHELLMSYESQRIGGSQEKAREHYRRALELSRQQRCSTWLSWAENVSVAHQDRQEFERLLGRVLAFDVNADPGNRLLNILSQRRARWLKEREDELFLEVESRP